MKAAPKNKTSEKKSFSVHKRTLAPLRISKAENNKIISLEEELVLMRKNMRSIVDEIEAAYEELELSNEELLSTNRKLLQLNERLTKSQQFNDAIFETVRESFLILDRKLHIKAANKTFYKKFQVNEKDVKGQLLFDVGNGAWNIPKLRELLEDIIPENFVFHDFEVVHTFKGVERTLLLNAHRMSLKNKREALIMLAIEDITDLKKAAKLNIQRDWYRNMADSVPVMIWLSDENSFRTYFNESWLEFTGRSMEQENGKGWTASIHPGDLKSYIKMYDAAHKNKKPFSFDYRLRTQAGEYRWMLDTARPAFSPDKEFMGFIGSSTDVHDKKINGEIT